ncbi:glycosyltransferase family 2 protein [bacterium]|nr:MAG: glycosyltransferase family 2 protein [bacterium]
MTSSALQYRATVIIPTKNRKDILRETVASILAQSIPVELLIMDDGSTDGTSQMLQDEFGSEPRVQVHRSPISQGPTIRRNEGAEKAQGEVIFTIDDDCTLPCPDTFAQTLAAFDHPRVGAVTIPFINVLKDKTLISAAPDSASIYATYDFYGGMVAFKRDVFLRLGGYRTYYFMHVEEPDLSLRLLSNGFIVRLGVAEPIHHHESPIRESKRLHELGPRNHVLYAAYNVPFPDVVPHMLITSWRAFAHTLKIRHPWLGVKGIARGWGASLHELPRRRPVSRVCYRLSRELKRRGAVALQEIEGRLS